MLASLLPGLRDLRTPLAVGYLWLLDFWLLFHESLPKSENPTSPQAVQSIFQLGTILGAGAMLAALTFIAYLIGSIATFRLPWNFVSLLIPPQQVFVDVLKKASYNRPIIRTPPRLSIGSLSIRARISKIGLAINYTSYLSMAAQLKTIVDRQIARKSEKTLLEVAYDSLSFTVFFSTRDPFRAAWQEDEDVKFFPDPTNRNTDYLHNIYMGLVGAELPQIAIQLQAKDRDLWDSFDRARSESEFRSGISWPLLPIIFVVSTEVSYWWALSLIVPATLLVLATSKSIEATSTLIQGLVLRLVEPPVMERLREATKSTPTPAPSGVVRLERGGPRLLHIYRTRQRGRAKLKES